MLLLNWLLNACISLLLLELSTFYRIFQKRYECFSWRKQVLKRLLLPFLSLLSSAKESIYYLHETAKFHFMGVVFCMILKSGCLWYKCSIKCHIIKLSNCFNFLSNITFTTFWFFCIIYEITKTTNISFVPWWCDVK